MTLEIFVVLILFQFKHLIADYYLQTPYMYENKGQEYNWFNPLALHSIVHGSFTIIIIGAYTGSVWLTFLAFLFDTVTHFITDRWKATRGNKPDEAKFWTNLGIDQMVHHIVGILIIFYVSTNF